MGLVSETFRNSSLIAEVAASILAIHSNSAHLAGEKGLILIPGMERLIRRSRWGRKQESGRAWLERLASGAAAPSAERTGRTHIGLQ